MSAQRDLDLKLLTFMFDNGVIELARRPRGGGYWSYIGKGVFPNVKIDGQRRKKEERRPNLWCLGLDLTRTSERTMNFSHFPRLV